MEKEDLKSKNLDAKEEPFKFGEEKALLILGS